MNTAPSGPGSGIPKPTAAVKGTSKLSKEDLTTIASLQPEKNKADSKQAVANIAATTETMTLSKSSPSKEQVRPHQQEPPSEQNRTETLPKSERSKKSPQQSVSIAMVSPIMSSQHSFSKDTSPADLTTTTTVPNDDRNNKDSNKKINDGSALVGGVDSTVKSVSAETKTVPKASSERDGSEEVEDALANIQPMQPLNRTSPYGGYARSLSGHRAARLPACLRLQADVHRVARHMMAASQDIARLYGAQRAGAGDYAEIGYVSDGDLLRAPTAEEVASGYVSEGGASLYARRPVPAKYAVRDPKLVNVLQDDR